ncbi:MAG TPA: hypothetical protein VFG39_06845 [Balneolaceae bacterium]|nr:hypothetical protein [Balneolaceae bacterium]
MGIRFDLIISSTIAGVIILMLFRVNTFMMETSVDNRLIHEMQNFADATALLIQNELRSLESIESLTDSTIRFATTEQDTIEIFKQGRDLIILRKDVATLMTETEEYAARLHSLSFTPKKTNNEEALNIANAAIIHFRVVTETTPEQHVGGKGQIQAYAEKQIYLRNIFYE